MRDRGKLRRREYWLGSWELGDETFGEQLQHEAGCHAGCGADHHDECYTTQQSEEKSSQQPEPNKARVPLLMFVIKDSEFFFIIT